LDYTPFSNHKFLSAHHSIITWSGICYFGYGVIVSPFFDFAKPPNGLRYLRWGGDGEAVQSEKGYGVENCLKCAQNPQRQVHALLGGKG